jgi:tripartite ATP-independent transporter DctP family solute receptor
MENKTGVLIVSIFALAVIIGCGRAADKKAPGSEFRGQFKLATVTPLEHTYSRGANRFAELVRERSGGRIQIVVYPDGKLGQGEKELLEAVRQGKIDLYVGSTGTLAGFSPPMGILDIPFLFCNYAHADNILDGPVGQKLMTDLETAQFKALSFWENGFRNLTNSRHAVKSPDDAKGLNIRTMENAIHLAAWKAVGVNPLPMPWGEVYKALQDQSIDGQENPIALIYSAKLNNVQKYLSLTQHIYSPAIMIAGHKVWQTIPKSDQEMMTKTALELAQYERKLGRDAEEKQIAELVAGGMVVTKDIDREAWRNAMAPVIEKYVQQFGRQKVDAILNTK